MSEFDAVILAAGLSSRMKHFKPLEPLAGEAALERTVKLFQQAGINDVLVVVGYRAEATTVAAHALGARVVRNKRFAEGMFTSVQAGVAALEGTRPFFLLPVDIPLVKPWTLQRLAQAFVPGQTTIIHPTFLGERGHPPLLAAQVRQAVLEADGDGGLRAVLDVLERQRPEAVVEVDAPDEGVLLDMDTNEDFQRLSRRAARLGAPTVHECEALWNEQNLGAQTREHCQAVAGAAICLGRALNAAGHELDLVVIEAAALVHDLAKGKRRHEAEGARLLLERGFDSVAEIVAAHRDIDLAYDAPITEREVVFMADKLMGGTTLMPLAKRYGRVLKRHADDPAAIAAITGRLKRAERVRRRMEAVIDKSLFEIVATCWGQHQTEAD